MRDSIEAVMQRLEQVLDDLDAIPRVAHEKYRSYDSLHRIEHSARSQANCIYDHMVAEADRRFVQREGIRQVELRGLKLWVFKEHTVFRFKKMDEDGATRNYPTKQARAFDFNRDLEGVPPSPIRVTVGYWLDPTQTSIKRVQVARPNGRKIDWCAAIVPTEEREADNRAWEEVSKQRGLG